MIPDDYYAAVPVSMFSRLGHRVFLSPSMLPDRIAGFDEGKDFVLLDENFPTSGFDYKKEIRGMISYDGDLMDKYDLLYYNGGIYLFRRK